MGAIQPWHIILVLLAFLILFGSKKLPDAARGLGRSMRIFKSEIKEMQSDGDSSSSQSGVTPTDTATEAQRELPTGSNPAPGTATPSDDIKKSA